MSQVSTIIYDNDLTECPACGEDVLLSTEEIEDYNNGISVPLECGECGTIFYLEKE